MEMNGQASSRHAARCRSDSATPRRGRDTRRLKSRQYEPGQHWNNQGEHMGRLEGKIALITGGNSGIGLATAKQFVNEGAYVFITGRREAELAAAKKQIGKNVTAIQGDVSNLDDLDRLFAQIKKEKD